MTRPSPSLATPSTPSAEPEMTPQQYGVGARFTVSVYDSDYVRIILDALADVDASGLEIETGDISTFVTGAEQRVLEYVRDVVARIGSHGVHASAGILLSRGCPGELQCALPPGVLALASRPVSLEPTGLRARAHWSLYPLLDGGDSGDHMTAIYAAIDDARRAGVYSGSDHYATRLDGDLAAVLETAANAWIAVGATVQHVTTHLTVSLNSPTPIPDDGPAAASGRRSGATPGADGHTSPLPGGTSDGGSSDGGSSATSDGATSVRGSD